MMQHFPFSLQSSHFSANNKEKTHFSSLFAIFLDERDGERFKYRSEKGINVSFFDVHQKRTIISINLSKSVPEYDKKALSLHR